MAVEKKSRLVERNAEGQDDTNNMERDSNKSDQVTDNSGFVAIPNLENGATVPKDRTIVLKNRRNYNTFDENSDNAGDENMDDLMEKDNTKLKTNNTRKLSEKTTKTILRRKQKDDTESRDNEIQSISIDNDAPRKKRSRSRLPGTLTRTVFFFCVILVVLRIWLHLVKDGNIYVNDELKETVNDKENRLQPSRYEQMNGKHGEDVLSIANIIGSQSIKDETKKVKHEVKDATIDNKNGVQSLKDENKKVKHEDKEARIDNTIGLQLIKDVNKKVKQVGTDASIDNKIGLDTIKDENKKGEHEVKGTTIDNKIELQSITDVNKKVKHEVKDATVDNKIGFQSITDDHMDFKHEHALIDDEIDKKSTYAKINITNDEDYKIKDKLDEADSLFQNGKLKISMDMFGNILNARPSSPRALWGYAQTNELSAKWMKSMVYTKRVVSALNTIIKSPDVPRDLLKLVIPKLVQTYVSNLPLPNLEMTWKYLSQSRNHNQETKRLFAIELERYSITKDLAETVIIELIETDPNDCIAMALMGKVFNSRHKHHGKAVEMLQHAVDLDCKGVRNPRYYSQLGKAYIKLGEREKANGIHNLGVERGLFLSRDQRAYHNAKTKLTGRPWWSHEESTYGKHLQGLESNWKVIRDEAMEILGDRKSEFELDRQGIIDEGTWKKLSLYKNGKRDLVNCKRAPRTCALVGDIRACTTLTRGQVKFSVIHPGSHLWAHCGPTNCRIRAHLGLQIPEGPRIRVGNETRTWIEGKFIIFDDSFEHEVWHDGTSGFRLVLIVDFWHPELTLEQRKAIKPI